MLFDPKKEKVAYTVAVVKPNSCLIAQRTTEILSILKNSKFIIFQQFQRLLFKQEVQNLYYKHAGKPYYDSLVSYMLSGECMVLLLSHETADPIDAWKKIIGPADPDEAKKKEPNSLRAKYGTSIIMNQLHGSDNNAQANKERDIFRFQVPQKVPQLTYDPFKISLDKVMKFLYPPNLEHTDINQRLDLVAQYGPVYNYHSVQQCLCKSCSPIGKLKIQEITRIRVAEEKQRLGILEDGKTAKTYEVKPFRVLREEDLLPILDKLCESCRSHCTNFTHLLGGRQMQHIITDNQIKLLGKQLNRTQLLELLQIEKGSAAKVMIEELDISEPAEIHYKRWHVEQLLSQLQTDFHGRFDFNHFRNLVLEDRRIRITYMISKITNKPVSRFPPITALDRSLSKQQLVNHDSPYFTLTRTLPLTLLMPQKKLNHTPLQFEKSIVDKKKLYYNQENIVTTKMMHRMLTKVVTVGHPPQTEAKSSVIMLRNYNEGRHGTWDNYSGLKGNSITGKVGGKHGQLLE